MPRNLLRCQSCRTVLNTDLRFSSVDIPEFFELREIEAVVEVEPRGYFISCPRCAQELRIARKYHGKQVQCKFCADAFRFDVRRLHLKRYKAFADCPHCSQEIRMADKYLGLKVECKRCGGRIQLARE